MPSPTPTDRAPDEPVPAGWWSLLRLSIAVAAGLTALTIGAYHVSVAEVFRVLAYHLAAGSSDTSIASAVYRFSEFGRTALLPDGITFIPYLHAVRIVKTNFISPKSVDETCAVCQSVRAPASGPWRAIG